MARSPSWLISSVSVVWPQRFMNLVKHIEHVIGLLDKGTPIPKIKSALLAAHEQAEAQDGALENTAKLRKENALTIATLKAEHQKEILRITELYASGKGILPPKAR